MGYRMGTSGERESGSAGKYPLVNSCLPACGLCYPNHA